MKYPPPSVSGSLYDINFRHNKNKKSGQSFLRQIPSDVYVVCNSSRLLNCPSDLVVTVFVRFDIFSVSP